MGKGQKALQQQATQQSQQQQAAGTAAQQRLVEGSPELQAREKLIADRRSAINSGDLRNAKDFVGNAANTAAREQDRETKANLLKTGVAGLASNYADATQIALADKMNKDEFARDSAAQNESDAKAYIADTENMESQDIATRSGQDAGIMGTAFGTATNNLNTAAQIAAARASIVPAIIGASISGASGVASAWFSKGA